MINVGTAAVILAGLTAGATVAEDIAVPSGLAASLHEVVIVEPERTILYLGVLAPAMGGATPMSFDQAGPDLDAICALVGLRLVDEMSNEDTKIGEVVVRMMDREVPYGGTDPQSVQFFSAYDVTGGECQWN